MMINETKILTLSRTWEKLIIVAAALAMSLAIYLLSRSTYEENLVTSLSQLLSFKVTKLQNDVRIRHQSQLSWKYLQKNAPMYVKDQIFTGSNSWTAIKDDQNNMIELSPYSLVELSFANNQPEVIIKHGEIKADIKRGIGLKVNIKNKVYDIAAKANNTQLNIAVNENEEMTLTSNNEVSIQTGKEQITLLPLEKLSVKDDISEVKKIVLNLVEPVAQSTFWSQDKSIIKFSWNSENSASNYKLNLRNKNSGNLKIIEVTKPQYKLSGRQPASNYQWWVETLDANGDVTQSLKQEFEVKSFNAPFLYSPENKGIVYTNTESALIRFSWEELTGALNYQLNIWQGQNLVDTQSLEQSTYEKEFPIGSYQWSIKTTSDDQSIVTETPKQTFNIMKEKSTVAGAISIFVEDQYFITGKSVKISTHWESNVDAEEFEIQIIKLDSNKISSQKIQGTSYDLEIKEPGEYQIKVNSMIDGEVQAEGTSNTFKVDKVELPRAPKLKKPQFEIETFRQTQPSFLKIVFSNIFGFNVFAQEIPAGAKVKFSWENIPGAKEYVFELAPNSQFNDSIQEKVPAPQYSWKSPTEPGLFFWRVRAVEKYGFMGPYSEVGKIKTVLVPVKPLIYPPKEETEPKPPRTATPDKPKTIVKEEPANEVIPEEPTKPIEPQIEEIVEAAPLILPEKHFAFGIGLTLSNMSQTPGGDAVTYLESSGTGFIPSFSFHNWLQTKSWYHYSFLNYGQSTMTAGGIDEVSDVKVNHMEISHYSYRRFIKKSAWLQGIGLRYKKYTFFVDSGDFSEEETRLGLAVSFLKGFQTERFNLQHLFKFDLGVGQFSEATQNLFSKIELTNIKNLNPKWSFVLRLSGEYQNATHAVSGDDKGTQRIINLSSVFELAYIY